VRVLEESGAERDHPSSIHARERLHIAPRFVAYGAEQKWVLRILVDDVTNHVLRGFEVDALYDDTVEPGRIETFVKTRDIPPNEMSDHDKTLTIPEAS